MQEKYVRFVGDALPSGVYRRTPEQYASRRGRKRPDNIRHAGNTYGAGHIPTNKRPFGSLYIDQAGYVHIKIDDRSHWPYQHRVVYEKVHEVALSSEEEIHHRDGDKTNNQIDNLMYCATHEEHLQQHVRERDEAGRFA